MKLKQFAGILIIFFGFITVGHILNVVYTVTDQFENWHGWTVDLTLMTLSSIGIGFTQWLVGFAWLLEELPPKEGGGKIERVVTVRKEEFRTEKEAREARDSWIEKGYEAEISESYPEIGIFVVRIEKKEHQI